MVLTDREIEAAIANGQIVIDPKPKPVAFSSTSLDLTLSKFLRVWKAVAAKGVEQIVCPAVDGYKFDDFAKQYSDLREIGGDGFVLNSSSEYRKCLMPRP